jgi:hypothetical protein
MSQIVSSLSNKFEQGDIRCFMFWLQSFKELGDLYNCLYRRIISILCFLITSWSLVFQLLIVIGSAKVNTFFTPATISRKKIWVFLLKILNVFIIRDISSKKNSLFFTHRIIRFRILFWYTSKMLNIRYKRRNTICFYSIRNLVFL